MPSTPHSAGTPESGPARRRRSSRGVLRKALLCSVAIAGVTPTLLAEAPPAKKQEAPPRVSALRCGRLLDVRTGTLREGAIVVVRGDRIEEVLERGAKLTEGVSLIDLSAFTVLPGLVDAHTHTFLQPGEYDVQLLKQSLPRRTLQAAAQARASRSRTAPTGSSSTATIAHSSRPGKFSTCASP